LLGTPLKEDAMLVQELMTSELVTVHPGTWITEAARTLLDKGITEAVAETTEGVVGVRSATRGGRSSR
jgi:CBS domain-containing protein